MKRTSMDWLGVGYGKRLLARAFLGSTVAAVALGCGGETIDAGDEPIDETESAIINGTRVFQAGQTGTVAVYTGYIRPCSGSLIRQQWVLTARHCITTDGSVFGNLIDPANVLISTEVAPGLTPPPSTTSRGVQFLAFPDQDLALVRVWPEVPGRTVGLWNGDANVLLGSSVRAMGYGRNVDGGNTEVENGTTGAGTLRMADLTVTAVADKTFDLAVNSSGQIIWKGDSGGPTFLLADRFARALPSVVGVHQTASPMHHRATDGLVSQVRGMIKRRTLPPGDFDRGGRADIALVGGAGWSSIPVAFSTGSGFTVTNKNVPDFPSWAQASGARPVAGDFNGDTVADIALVGGAGWNSIPIAISQENGSFSVLNFDQPEFAGWTRIAGVRALPGDFNGDGKADIALTGGSGWGSIPIAFSQGNGRFSVSNLAVPNFSGWASSANVKIVSGDFDGDGRDDIALTGVTGWGSVPVAFSNGDGTFFVQNRNFASFPALASTAGAQAVAGDFNGDGRDDIALTGASGWSSIPIAFSNGDATFRLVNNAAGNFPAWAATAGAKAVTGDFNGDVWDDIALTGAPGWGTIPLATSNGSGNFTVTAPSVANFPTWAAASGAKPVSGH